MPNRNDLLRQAATATGVADDLSKASRNEILLAIAHKLGVFPVNHSRNNILMSILAFLRQAAQPSDMPRNWYIRQIAEHYGASSIPDNMTELLRAWKDNAIPPVIIVWILELGVWDDGGIWMDDENWQDAA